jgi:hypothetical protein
MLKVSFLKLSLGVEKFLKTASLSILILLYGFVISSYSEGISLLNSAPIQQQAETYKSAFSKSQLYHTTPTETAFSIVAKPFPSSLKNQSVVFKAILLFNQQLFLTIYLQNSSFSKNVLVRLRQLDIFFPFHYFW